MRLRVNRFRLMEAGAPVVGFLLAMILLLVIVTLVGENPFDAVGAIFRFGFSTATRVARILSQAIPLFLAGIAVAFAFQASVFNIGVEGQYFVGGLVGALAGIYLRLPPFLHIPVVVIAGMIGGALWAGIPALLKATRGVHEVITTIMFNSIAIFLVNYLVNRPLSGFAPGTSLEPQTAPLQESAHFLRINSFFQGLGWNIDDRVYLDYSLIVALIMGILVWLVVYKTRQGFEVRAVGTSMDASAYAGIRVKRVQVGAFLTSGALAGLIGLQEIFAIRHFYTFEIASGVGFDGIAIALIGRNNPGGVAIAALLFAFLKNAGYALQLYTSVPNSVVYVITGMMIILIVVTNELAKRYISALRKKEAN